jgi:hypothetical protein
MENIEEILLSLKDKALEATKEGINHSFSVFVTTVYAKINGKCKGVFYQQTPINS